MILDFDDPSTAAEQHAQIAIVGAGPAGLTLARELSAVASVLLIDAGGLALDAQQQALLDGDCIGLPYPLTETRARGLGGSSMLWAGYCARFDAHDFEHRRFMQQAGWPFGASELQPYYGRVAQLLGLEAPDFDAPSMASGCGAAPPFAADELTLTAWRFAAQPLRFGEHFQAELSASRSVTVWLHASVVDIRLDAAHGCVRELAVRSLRGRTGRVWADTVVLACGGIDTARLLLHADSQLRTGVGNETGQVGRHFMEHPHRPVRGVRACPSAFMQRSVERDTDRQGRSFMLAFGVPAPQQQALGILNARAHVYRTPTMTDAEPARIGLFMEQEPNPLSRVLLSDRVDALGMRRARLDWRLSELDQHSWRRTEAVVADALRRHGLASATDEDRLLQDDTVLSSNHQLGTTRMSSDPDHGVVDPQCRIHTLDNAYIVGGSVFPTVSWANPTFTVMALVFRLADHLRGLLGRRDPPRTPGAPERRSA